MSKTHEHVDIFTSKKTSLWRLNSSKTTNRSIVECFGLLTITAEGKLFRQGSFDQGDTLVGMRLTPTVFIVIYNLEPWVRVRLDEIAQQVNNITLKIKTEPVAKD